MWLPELYVGTTTVTLTAIPPHAFSYTGPSPRTRRPYTDELGRVDEATAGRHAGKGEEERKAEEIPGPGQAAGAVAAAEAWSSPRRWICRNVKFVRSLPVV